MSVLLYAGTAFSYENSPSRGSCVIAPSVVSPKLRPMLPFSSLGKKSCPSYPLPVSSLKSCPGVVSVFEQNRSKGALKPNDGTSE